VPKRSKTDKADLFVRYWRICRTGNQLSIDDPVSEFTFAAPRKFRYDFAWESAKVAVEVDGNAWHTMGGGSHGKDSDREKRNIGASLGWVVFYFSPTMLNNDPQGCIDIVCAKIQERIIPF
jgi:hypothetical protein